MTNCFRSNGSGSENFVATDWNGACPILPRQTLPVFQGQAHGEVHKQFFSFLQLWLSAHIKCIDRKYGDHARATGSRAA